MHYRRDTLIGMIFFGFSLIGCSNTLQDRRDTAASSMASHNVPSEAPCRSVSEIRITTSSQLSRLQDVCEVNGRLFIYTDEIHTLVIPRLRRVGGLHLETEKLQALILPELEDVGNFTAIAPGLSLLELPKLKRVEQRFLLRDLNTQFLDINKLESAEQVQIQNCRKLEFVFADNIRTIKLIEIKNLPRIAEESEENLRSAARYQSREELRYRDEQRQLANNYRAAAASQQGINQQIRTTGHPTQFDSFGMLGRYYQKSPLKFEAYEESINLFKFRIGYQINDSGFGRVVWNLNWLDFINR